MQPLKISIEGDYFDCQIYRGRLYLWTIDGDLKVYDWNALVDYLIQDRRDKIAMTFSFKDGHYLYKSSLVEIFSDDEFRSLLLNKFSRLYNRELIIGLTDLEKFIFGQQETPTGEIPTDTEIYNSKLYFITDRGLFAGSAHRNRSDKYPVSSRPKKLWDCNLLSIKANKYPQIALSGGDEGLFELNVSIDNFPSKLKFIEKNQPIYQISDMHSSFANYSYLNIYNSSYIDQSYLAKFKWGKYYSKIKGESFNREYDRIITENTLFNSNNNSHRYLSWGVEDKIYRAKKNCFEIIKVSKNKRDEEEDITFNRLANINLSAWKGRVICGGTAYFGNVVECENALVIIQSNKESFTIPGPITKWRIYPRSLNYENHLHVILDDRIEIYSFHHDYFENQDEKDIGIEFHPEKYRFYSKNSYLDDFDMGNEIYEKPNFLY